MRFECVRCGECCRQSGALRLLAEDIEDIAELLGLSAADFIEQYNVQHTYRNLYYIEIHDGCLWLNEDNTCAVEAAKPFFCRNYIPFVDNPGSPIYAVCRGIGKGKEWTEEEIQKRYDAMTDKLVVVVKDGDA